MCLVLDKQCVDCLIGVHIPELKLQLDWLFGIKTIEMKTLRSVMIFIWREY